MGARRCQTDVRQSKGPGRGRGLPRPQHPRGKDAVEQGLHQRRAEERRAALALEPHAQGLLQRGPHGVQRRCVAGRFHPRQPVAGVGRHEAGQIPRFGELGPVSHYAASGTRPGPGRRRWRKRGDVAAAPRIRRRIRLAGRSPAAPGCPARHRPAARNRGCW